MADRPLRPATDRRLGGLLPHQLANRTSADPKARGLAIPRFHPWVVCGISQSFDWLSPTSGYVPMCYSPVRHSTQELPPFRVRLACVRHAASVQSEPGSNSSVQCLLSSPTLRFPREWLSAQLLSLKVIDQVSRFPPRLAPRKQSRPRPNNFFVSVRAPFAHRHSSRHDPRTAPTPIGCLIC